MLCIGAAAARRGAMASSSAPLNIVFSLARIFGPFFLFFCPHIAARAELVWPLNTSYTLSQSNFSSAYGSAWDLERYPGSAAVLMMGGSHGDVSTYLCLLSSPRPSLSSSPPASLSDLSFTLSIYLYSANIIYRGAIVWTANRDRPVSAVSSVSLHLLPDGNLALFGDDPNIPIWSSNTSHQGVTAMELTNNPVSLVLRNSSGYIFWQSADYPTDTLTMTQFLLPGRNLTSWASSTDPSSGIYTLLMEPSGLALYSSFFPSTSPQPYWIWSYYGFNDSISVKHTCESRLLAAFMNPEGALILTLNYPRTSVSANNESYWPPFCSFQPDYPILPFEQYGVGVGFPISNSTILRLDSDGSLRAYTLGTAWTIEMDIFNSDSCLLPNHCGPYGVCTSGSQCTCPANSSVFLPFNTSDMSFGCSRVNNLDCNASLQAESYETMLQLRGMGYFANNYTPLLNISTEKTCVDECFKNCSCHAAFWHEGMQACHHQPGDIGSLNGALDRTKFLTYLKVNVIPQHSEDKGSKTTVIVASVVSTVSALIALTLLILYFGYRKLASGDDEDEDEEGNLLDAVHGLPSRYSYRELQQITNGFESQLGRGGFGAVYAGVLQDGTQVAVKKLESLKQGNKEFKTEVAIMGGIRHNNLLCLLGFCAQKGHRLLVYEYMKNGSLDQWLFAAEARKRSQLTWDVRCKIALGTARGLAYLHDDCREKILHLDVKPQNILLDDSFNAKVADFGLSRLVDRSETHVMTTMRGTPGYLAPEWLKESTIDEKCDVYSFGMLLMELISGRKNLDHTVEPAECMYYPEWAFWQAQQEDVTKLTDVSIETEEDVAQLRRMINTAFLCVLEDSASRPSMANVVHMLQGHVPVGRIQLSTLHQGLLFVLKSPSSFAQARINEELRGLLQSCSEASSLLQAEISSSAGGGVMSSFSISGSNEQMQIFF